MYFLAKAIARRILPAHVLGSLRRHRSMGREAVSARYCYAVWMRHLVKTGGLAAEATTVAELGPGASLGVGIAALLCGAERYVALDVVRQATVADNVAVFDGLVELLRARAGIPGPSEFPEVQPNVDSLQFPSQILAERRMDQSLSPSRLSRIRRQIVAGELEYVVPWGMPALGAKSVDLIVSQAVLEHVEDLETAYAAMFNWLRPGGLMSHQIDFRNHGTSREWNGHWGYSGHVWRILRGDRAINRQPISRHLQALRNAGFSLLDADRQTRTDGLRRRDLHRDWGWLSDDDLSCAGAFVQARRPLSP